MLRWLGSRKPSPPDPGGMVTDDPLAAIQTEGQKHIYAVSRSVFLPRVALKIGAGVNPIFEDSLECPSTSCQPDQPETAQKKSTEISPSAGKSASSGYESQRGSSSDPAGADRLTDDAITVLEQNANFVKSILFAIKANNNKKTKRSIGSLGSSAAGTLTTIPEGKVDFSIPRPVWPKSENCNKLDNVYDSLVDDALQLYSNLSRQPKPELKTPNERSIFAQGILKELHYTIKEAVKGKTDLTPEDILKCVSERISVGLELLQQTTEDDMRALSTNLMKNEKLSSVVRAFTNSSSGNSSQTSSKNSPEWNRSRTNSSGSEEFYHVPSQSSSSGFSDSVQRNQYESARLPVFVHENLSNVPNGVRNAMIYGTLCRSAVKSCGANEKLLDGKEQKTAKESPTRRNLRAPENERPSYWEIYYGAGVNEGDVTFKAKPTDTPCYPAGRPEVDFTLDLPRSELLMKKMKAAKKWRCRCRILTTFLCFVFFLLSVMAVSLMLTRGKRMFGSMV